MDVPDSINTQQLQELLRQAQPTAERDFPAITALPVLPYERPMDLAVAVESLILHASRNNQGITVGMLLAAASYLLSSSRSMLLSQLQEQDGGGVSQAMAMLHVTADISRLRQLQAAVDDLHLPAVAYLLQLEAKSRGDANAALDPRRVDLISTAVLGALGIDHEVFDDYFSISRKHADS